MDFKDYYEILGVAPDADKKTIQQTFRQLARKHHPDVNPGNKEAEEKFKTFNEAYQVLSDTKQRKKYDELRAQYQEWAEDGWPPTGFRLAKLVSSKTRARERAPNMPMRRPGRHVRKRFPVFRLLCQYLGAQHARGSGKTRGNPPGLRRGRDIEYEVDLTLEEAFHGAEAPAGN